MYLVAVDRMQSLAGGIQEHQEGILGPGTGPAYDELDRLTAIVDRPGFATRYGPGCALSPTQGPAEG